LDAVAQLLPPHYSPISQAESDLAVGKFGYIMTVNFLNRGALSLEFLFALMGTFRLTEGGISRYRGGFYLLGAWAVGAILLAFFPTDVPPIPVSWHGAIHLVVAIIAFIGGAFGAFWISYRMDGVKTFRGLRRIALPIAALASILCLLDLSGSFFAPRIAEHYGGLIERLFLGSVLLWIGVVSAYMLRNGPRSGSTPPARQP
jgi:Protein of unknown function (DUF998)